MTTGQRNHFFGALWPSACATQGWKGKVETEAKRKEMILAATTLLHDEVPKMRPPTDSLGACDEDQLTLVFAYALMLALPDDLDAARAVANPAETIERNRRKKLLYVLREKAHKARYNDAYLGKMAEADCRQEGVRRWDDLSRPALKRLLIHLDNRASGRTTRKPQYQ